MPGLVKLGTTAVGSTYLNGTVLSGGLTVTVPANTPLGTYPVSVSKSDDTGTITAQGTFGVTAAVAGGGVTLSAPLGTGGPTSFPNQIYSTFDSGFSRSYDWGLSAGNHRVSIAYDGSPGTQNLMLEIGRGTNNAIAALDSGLLSFGRCGLPGNTAGGPTCASLGINFNSTAGTVTFTNVPMTYTRGGTGSAGTLTGTLNFAPF